MITSDLGALLTELGSVKLLAVTKQQSIENIKLIIKAGIYRLGENYVQEAIPKIHAFSNKNYADLPLEWHFIGQIQSNKTQEIAKYFDWAQSLDRKKIADCLNHHRLPELSPLNVCIEINETGKIHKSGIKLDILEDFIDHIRHLPHLRFRGLMTTVTEDYEKTAKAFYDLKKQGYNIDTLSMGMSQDYQSALRLGATMIRLGTRIFGERKKIL